MNSLDFFCSTPGPRASVPLGGHSPAGTHADVSDGLSYDQLGAKHLHHRERSAAIPPPPS